VEGSEGDDWTPLVSGGSEEVVGQVRLILTREHIRGKSGQHLLVLSFTGFDPGPHDAKDLFVEANSR